MRIDEALWDQYVLINSRAPKVTRLPGGVSSRKVFGHPIPYLMAKDEEGKSAVSSLYLHEESDVRAIPHVDGVLQLWRSIG